MKLARLLGMVVLLAGALFFVLANEEAEEVQTTVAEETSEAEKVEEVEVAAVEKAYEEMEEVKAKFVKVTADKPTSIREELDPMSPIIRQTRKNEYLDLIAVGEKGRWYRVRVDGKEGWLDTKAGKAVQNKGNPYIALILSLLVLGGFTLCLVFFLKKQQGRNPEDADANSNDTE